jgi:hypothetical protein
MQKTSPEQSHFFVVELPNDDLFHQDKIQWIDPQVIQDAQTYSGLMNSSEILSTLAEGPTYVMGSDRLRKMFKGKTGEFAEENAISAFAPLERKNEQRKTRLPLWVIIPTFLVPVLGLVLGLRELNSASQSPEKQPTTVPSTEVQILGEYEIHSVIEHDVVENEWISKIAESLANQGLLDLPQDMSPDEYYQLVADLSGKENKDNIQVGDHLIFPSKVRRKQ